MPAELQLTRQEVSNRRRSPWRRTVRERLEALGPHGKILADGFLAHFQSGRLIEAAQAVVAELDEAARRAVWACVFPNMVDAVECAWTHLPPTVIVRREGWGEGMGHCFAWPVGEGTAAEYRFDGLRRLMICVSPFPELDLAGSIANSALLTFGSIEEYSGDYREDSTGLMYNDSVPAYPAVAVLEQRAPGNEEIAEVLLAGLKGHLPQAEQRTCQTALLCANRPDLWAEVDQLMLDSGLEPKLRTALAARRLGGHPGAWRHFLATCAEHGLGRFEMVRTYLLGYFGVPLDLQRHSNEFDDFLRRWHAMHEDAALRARGLTDSDPLDFLLALWATATDDGPAALEQVRDPATLSPLHRKVATLFLQICPDDLVSTILMSYATEPETPVEPAMVLNYKRARRFSTDEANLVFDKVLHQVRNPPAPLVLPAPFANEMPDPQANFRMLVALLPPGREPDLLEWLPKLAKEERTDLACRVVSHSLKQQDQRLIEMRALADDAAWTEWTGSPEGRRTLARRQILLRLVSDNTPAVAERAVEALRGLNLVPEEIRLLHPALKSATASKRLVATQLLSQLPDPIPIALSLLDEKPPNLRLCGLELLRQLAAGGQLDEVRTRFSARQFKPSGQQETRACETLIALWQGSAAETSSPPPKPTTADAFGLVDPATLPLPVSPQDHDVIVHSPVTLRLAKYLENWYQTNRDLTPDGTPLSPDHPADTRTLRQWLPFFESKLSVEANLARFPLMREVSAWWQDRPAELRDPDGFELLRLDVFIRTKGGSHQHPALLKFALGLDEPAPPAYDSVLERLHRWLMMLHPPGSGHERYVFEVMETVFARIRRLREQQPDLPWNFNASATGWPGFAVETLMRHGARHGDHDLKKRLWELCRTDAKSQSIFPLADYYWLPLHKQGIVSDDELMWNILGNRDPAKYGQDFGNLILATNMLRSDLERANAGGMLQKDTPHWAVIFRMIDRILELELSRGEAPEPWTHAAGFLKVLPGAERLARCLIALGELKPSRGRPPHADLTRAKVLTKLIRVSCPLPTDTPEQFREQLAPHRIPRSRLFEIAILSPQWIDFIACATGVPGLRDAVEWLFAHLREPSWQWQANAKQLWEGSLDLRTPLTPQNLMDGEVDVAWFFRAYATVGEEIWNELHASAKFATSGGGHTRARLAADALLGRTAVADLQEWIETKGNLDAVRTVGLPPLPDDERERCGEVLRRYEILQAFRRVARKSKAQLRASQEAAFEAGLHNLARKAGCEDPIRFEWAMEAESAADLTSGSLQTTIGDTAVALVIQPDGTLELTAKQAGEKLAKVPAALKANSGVKALLDRQKELAVQARRLRPALESLMVNGIAMPAAEWQMILRHPLAGSLLARLVLATDAGPLGYPDIATGRISGIGQNYISWPEDEPIHIAHPLDLLPASQWHAWQQDVFARSLVQPFKQLFRETYLATEAEKITSSVSNRFDRQQIDTTRAFGILSGRMWVYHPEHGLHRTFRADGVVAGLHFNESFHHPGEIPNATIAGVGFSDLSGKPIPLGQVPARVFSEALRDVDLIVSIAHATGANPEAAVSTVAMRADLIRETCAVLGLGNVALHPSHAAIAGTLGNYRVHLASGLVHRETGPALPLSDVPEPERGRIFLPFADEDPLTASIITRVILFAGDAEIKDPVIARLLRS